MDLSESRKSQLTSRRLVISVGLTGVTHWKFGSYCGVRLWGQVPASSLPNNERALADLARCSVAEWRAISGAVLDDWILCSDGRLYHPLLAE